jgi:hypothetical protein
LTLTMIGFPIRRVGKLPVARQNWCARCPKIPDQTKDWPMWEKCVGCGEGLFAGDAFCGNCGRPVTPAVPAAREPDGLESAPLAVPTAAPAADLVQVRIIPADHDLAAPQQADSGPADSEQADSEQAPPPEQAPTTTDPTSPENDTAAPVRAAATRLSGSANLDPIRNARYFAYVLRQAGLFIGVYLLIETVLWLYLPLSRAAGTTHGSALRLEIDSVWTVALALAVLFWLIPVPALLTEWSLLMEQGSDAAQVAFDQINSAFGTHGAPLDSQRLRTVSRHGEDDREYLELRRGHFRGYISCFVHGADLYVGWSFWLYMSPLRLLLMVIGRNIRDAISRRNAIQRSLRFESARALVAAIHGATLAGIDAASDQLDPAGPQLARETAVDMNVRLG